MPEKACKKYISESEILIQNSSILGHFEKMHMPSREKYIFHMLLRHFIIPPVFGPYRISPYNDTDPKKLTLSSNKPTDIDF